MGKIILKGKEYDFIKVSDDPLQVEVQFDSHGKTNLKRINGNWLTDDQVYIPKGLSLREIGEAIESQV